MTAAMTATGELEAAVIGSALCDAKTIPVMAALVRPEDFQNSRLGELYAAILYLESGGAAVDPVTLRCEMERRGTPVESIIVADCIDVAVTGHHAEWYAKETSRAAMRRRQSATVTAAAKAIAGAEPVDDVISRLRADLERTSRGASVLEATPMADIVTRCQNPERAASYVATGYRMWDSIHGGGLEVGSLTVVGAAPRIGKSQLAVNISVAAKRHDGSPARVLYVSLEMSEELLYDRIVAIISRQPLSVVRSIRNRLASSTTLNHHGAAVAAGAAAARELPIRVIAGKTVSPDDIRSLAARYAGQIDLLVVDYLQLARGGKGQDKRATVEDMSRACKAAAGDGGMAVIAVASLNRDGYRDADCRPNLAHLKECGDIEYDADNVWMLWRRCAEGAGRETLEAYVRKQRQGPTDWLEFDYSLVDGVITEKEWRS